MICLNETHNPVKRSWLASANGAGDFPLQNLPFGVFRRGGGVARGGVAIGDRVFDLKLAAEAGMFKGDAAVAAAAGSESTLNALMALGNVPASALRAQIFELMSADSPARAIAQERAGEILVPLAEAELLMPVEIGAFTDMMVSTFHVSGGRRGTPFREPPGNFKHIPLGYNSRASSVRLTGTPVIRPHGVFAGSDGSPEFGPEPRQDFELELGTFVSRPNPLGAMIPIGEAQNHIFGYCLLNDWSARGIQMFEMAPLGPFLGKSLMTSISPWIVTTEAMAPFATSAFKRPVGDPSPLQHLSDEEDGKSGGIDLRLEAYLLTSRMRESNLAPALICATNFKYMYWTFAQIFAHHTSNGCNLNPGDLISSGTTSGPGDAACGCLWEKTANGSVSFGLPEGESRLFLEDGDEVIFRGVGVREGFVSIGFGECRGRIEAAISIGESLASSERG